MKIEAAQTFPESSGSFPLSHLDKIMPLAAAVFAAKNIVVDAVGLAKRGSLGLLHNVKDYWVRIAREVMHLVSCLLIPMPLYLVLLGRVSLVIEAFAALVSSVLASVQFIWQMAAESIALKRTYTTIVKVELAIRESSQIPRALQEYRECKNKWSARIACETDPAVRQLQEEDETRELHREFGVNGSMNLKKAEEASDPVTKLQALQEARRCLKSKLVTHSLAIASAVAFLGALILGFFTVGLSWAAFIGYSLSTTASLCYAAGHVRYYLLGYD